MKITFTQHWAPWCELPSGDEIWIKFGQGGGRAVVVAAADKFEARKRRPVETRPPTAADLEALEAARRDMNAAAHLREDLVAKGLDEEEAGRTAVHPTTEDLAQAAAETWPWAFRTARQTAGLTQEGLARQLGCGSGIISRWERGLSRPRTRALLGVIADFRGQDSAGREVRLPLPPRR